jgi:AmmeMemoRadiSam system protein B/AmmeMemoRadiSam system protein A
MKILSFLTIILISLMPGCNSTAADNVRPPAVAGAFYPDDPTELGAMLREMLQKASMDTSIGRPVALVSPHAGYVYSGNTAAHGYKLLEGLKYKTVIIIGPSHRVAFEGCAVYNRGSWRTPLGDVPIDTQLADELCSKSDGIYPGLREHSMEHSIEVQVPFLQTVLSDFKIVPVEMGHQTVATIEMLADALVETLRGRDDVLMVVSTDLSHFFPRTAAAKFDAYSISLIREIDGATMASKIQTDEAKMCGGGPTAAVLMACREMGVSGVRILKYDDSGTASGDLKGVVGYVSAVLYKEDKVGEKDLRIETDEYLDKDEQHRLIEIVRKSIEAALDNKPAPEFDVPVGKLSDNGAAFVTLTIRGQLRGCIGYTEAVIPLKHCVSECAISAAFRDPRFTPLTKDEYQNIDVEISVLTPLVDVSSIDDIMVGRDGLMISHMGRRGLLLPQVATDYGWDRETFLINTCRKAGLPDDAWSQGARIQKFTAFVFGEK